MSEPRYNKHAPKPTNAAMVKLNAVVDQAAKLDEDLRARKEAIGSLEKQLQHLLENVIPGLMQECGQKMCVTEQGLKVEVDTKLWANLPSPSAIMKEKDPEKQQALIARREAGIKWLEDNNHADMIKRSFEIEFGREDQAWANKFRRDLEARKKPLHFTEGEEVNQNTLSALIRALSKDGKEYPAETLGVYPKTVAKISRGR